MPNALPSSLRRNKYTIHSFKKGRIVYIRLFCGNKLDDKVGSWKEKDAMEKENESGALLIA